MKKHFLCRIASFALAAILAAESSMTAMAAEIGTSQMGTSQIGNKQEAVNAETQETQTGTDTEQENGTDDESIEGTAESGSTEGETEEVTNSTDAEEESESTTKPGSTEEESEGTTETAENTAETEGKEEIAVDGETALAAPANINKTVMETGIVVLMWSPVEGAEAGNYRIYRSETIDGEYQLYENGTIANAGAVITFTDSGAELGKAYFYKICGYQVIDGNIMEGAFSEIVDTTIAMESIAWSDGTDEAVTLNRGETKKLSITYTPVNATKAEVVWTSDKPAVAAVDNEGTISAVGKGTANITAKAGELTLTRKVTVSVAAQSVTLNQTQMILRKGTYGVLEARVTPVDADGELKWESSNPAVAEVDNGKIKAVGAGKTDITAKFGDKTAVCEVTVSVPVSQVVLEKDSIEIVKGGNSKEVTAKILPLEASEQTMTCEVENENLVSATVSGNSVTLTSKDTLGKTTVKVTADGQSAALSVNIVEEEDDTQESSEAVPVSRLKFDLTDAERLIVLDTEHKQTFQLTAKIYPENATNQKITWTSSDEKIAAVSESGLISAVGKGMAQITAKTDNGVFDKVTVLVESGVEDVSLTEKAVTLYCNADNAAFEGKTLYKTHQAMVSDTSLQCRFYSSNEEVATVSEEGLITALEPGEADIVAVNYASGKSDYLTVTVKRLVEEIKLPAEEITILKGTRLKLKAQVLPEKVTSKAYKWSSSDRSNDVESEELVALKTGTVTVTARAEDSGKVMAVMTVNIIEENTNAVSSKLSLTYKAKNSATVKSGKQIMLDTVIKNKSGEELAAEGKTIVYKSADEKIAVVDANGKITAVGGGKTKITASVLDGSNVSGSFTVTVEQRPEEITFAREEFVIAPGKTATIKPTLLPSKSKVKGVTWSITGYTAPEGSELTETAMKAMIKINASGKVTVAGNAPENLTATVRCVSKAYDGKTEIPVYGEVTVKAGKTKVTKLTMKKTALELTGLGAQAALEYTAKGADETTNYVWTSSDADVVTVDGSGKVTVTGYGTAKVTLCVDNAISAAVNVAAYPVKKGQSIGAASGNYGVQAAANDGNASVQLIFINKTTKSKLDAELFTFTSSNPEVAYVDEKGIAYANPRTTIKGDTTVTITAALKDDPFKRKATTKVTVWKNKQVKSIDFKYWDMNGKESETFTDSAEEEYKKDGTFKLKAYAYDANYVEMKNAALSFSVSDSSLAEIAVDEKDKTGHTIIVTVKKPGKFKITCTANDKLHKNRQATFGMYSGMPVLKTDSLGSINKQGERIHPEDTTIPLVLSDQVFTMVGANGTEIAQYGVKVEAAKRKDAEGNESTIAGGKFRVIRQTDDPSKYRLAMSSEELENCKTGTYTITLAVERTAMDIENNVDTATEKVTATFKITNSLPTVKIANTTVNSFEKGTWTKLKITTKAEIENISLASEGELAQFYEIRQMQDGWYIAIKEEKFDECASKKIRGTFEVMLKGYAKPRKVSITVTAKSTKPSLKQLSIPDILTAKGDTAQIVIYNNTAKKNLTDYTMTLKTSANAKWDVIPSGAADYAQVQLSDTSTITRASSFKQKAVIGKASWRTPIEMYITVKASPAGSPAVSFGKAALTLNTLAESEKYGVTVKTNKSNLTFKEGAWEFADSAHAALFTADYADGCLTIGLKPEAVAGSRITGTKYTLQFKNVFAETGYETVKTSAITVTVNKKAPAIGTIKLSGRLDLLNRKGSTLTGTINISGLNANIKTIALSNGTDTAFTDNFYCVQNKNKFTIHARNNAVLSAKAYKGKVKVTLENGYVLEKDISFKTTQSVPKLKPVAGQNLYKAAAEKVVDFNLNESMPDGIRIEEAVTRVLPAGLGVEYDNGHAYVVISDDSIKAGTYTIQADIYFKGAQSIAGSEMGKPVRIAFKVTVKEQSL